MRTTLDLPDELFKYAKLAAVHEGVPLKTVIARALERGFASLSSASPVCVQEAPPTLLRQSEKPISETWTSVRDILEEGWAAQTRVKPVTYSNPRKQKTLEALRAHKQRR